MSQNIVNLISAENGTKFEVFNNINGNTFYVQPSFISVGAYGKDQLSVLNRKGLSNFPKHLLIGLLLMKELWDTPTLFFSVKNSVVLY